MPGFHQLDVGEMVDFDWEEADQDGFRYRAVRVWPQRARSGSNEACSGPPAYRSRLSITPDETD